MILIILIITKIIKYQRVESAYKSKIAKLERLGNRRNSTQNQNTQLLWTLSMYLIRHNVPNNPSRHLSKTHPFPF